MKISLLALANILGFSMSSCEMSEKIRILREQGYSFYDAQDTILIEYILSKIENLLKEFEELKQEVKELKK